MASADLIDRRRVGVETHQVGALAVDAPARVIGEHPRGVLDALAQLFVRRAHLGPTATQRVLLDRALGDGDAAQLLEDRRHLAHRHAEAVVQGMGAREHPGAQPVRRRAALTRRDLRMGRAHAATTIPAGADLDAVGGHLRLGRLWQICAIGHLDALVHQLRSAAKWTAFCGQRHLHSVGDLLLARQCPAAEATLSGLAPRALRIGLLRALRERGRLAFRSPLLRLQAALQLGVLRPQAPILLTQLRHKNAQFSNLLLQLGELGHGAQRYPKTRTLSICCAAFLTRHRISVSHPPPSARTQAHFRPVANKGKPGYPVANQLRRSNSSARSGRYALVFSRSK